MSDAVQKIRGTTIISVRRYDKVAMAGDGQVTMGNAIVKTTARKVRRLAKDKVLAGFAGASADAFTLFSRLEEKLDSFNQNLTRAAVELAKDWRTDRSLRRLEALLIAVDAQSSLLISGTGDVIEPDRGVLAIGSGGSYALAAAYAMLDHTNLSAVEIAGKAVSIAQSICVYTGGDIVVEEL